MADRFLINPKLDVKGQVLSEGQQKKATRDAKLLTEKTEACKKLKAENKGLRKLARTNGAKYNKEYAREERNLINARRQAHQQGNFFIEPEAKLIFVVRIAGTNKLPPKPRKILELLRLRQMNNGVFVKVNKCTLHMLRIIQSYIAYGYADVHNVRRLLFKRGFGRINKQRIPLDDNRKIHDSLGKYGISCMEDLVHEIYTVGPNFKHANNFLATFKLKTPKGGWNAKRHGFNEPRKGDWGNREELMNQLIKRML